ncbi:hypothetical protein [Weissella thailandensis]|uniref:Uncharacterized protein n=1 Tax=Weissella thailandensis TaxID=89061 RepID=A0ABX9I2A2_9LACO|nr:hypothetical protein [Weissella thailandensis]NKY90075.1 hypothetical protein [Weissella thailandensis]RDS58831.1 hypothetical protein DWV05_09155 [Weissella thailandensis]GEP75432.1 hypothetical protein WTH01_16790 [Weissella thailandensis]
MSNKMKWLISIIAALMVITGGVSYGIYKHNQPLSDEAFSKLEIDEQFEKAPAGHYVHLRKDDPTLYRTTWSAKQIKHYFIYKNGKAKNHLPEGNYNEKTKLGTNQLFNDKRLIDKVKGDGILGQIHTALFDNSKFNENMSYDSDLAFNWYFNSPEQAQKDPDVKENANDLIR